MDGPDLAAAELHQVQHAVKGRLSLSETVKDFIAGAMGGMLGVTAGQPLDTLRIRIQQKDCPDPRIFQVWRSMAKTEGTRGLFKGMSYPLYTTGIQNAVTFQAQRAGCRVLTQFNNGSESSSTTTRECAGSFCSNDNGEGSSTSTSGMGSKASSSSASSGGSSSSNEAYSGSWATICVAGMFAGGVQTVISCPVELLKIRLQLQQAMPGSSTYAGPLAMLRRVVQQEGIAGLFRGFWLTFLRDTPSYGLYFMAYRLATDCTMALQAAVVAAAAAPASRGPLPAPQVASAESTAAAAAAHGEAGIQVLVPSAPVGGRPEAPEGCWDGSGCEEERGSSGSSSSRGEPGPLTQLVAGGMAGMLSWASVYPIDMVKSRMQAQGVQLAPAGGVGVLPGAASGGTRYTSAWACAADAVRESGWRGLTRGLGTTLGRAFVVNGAVFGGFEAVMRVLDTL